MTQMKDKTYTLTIFQNKNAEDIKGAKGDDKVHLRNEIEGLP